MEREYTVVLVEEPEAGEYSVFVPALPGCVTHGRTVEEAVANAREAIAGYIESLTAHGETVPLETSQPQVLTVTVVADAAA